MLARFSGRWSGSLHEDDVALISAFLDGEPDAVETLDGWIRCAAWSFRARLGEDWDDLCQDLLMEFTKLLRAGRFAGQARLKTYLWRVTNNACLDRLRSQNRWQLIDLDSVVERLEQDGLSLPAAGDQLAARDLLRAVLERTSAECRRLWQLILSGFSYQEMSDHVGVASGTLRVRVLRCRKRAQDVRDRLAGEPS